MDVTRYDAREDVGNGAIPSSKKQTLYERQLVRLERENARLKEQLKRTKTIIRTSEACKSYVGMHGDRGWSDGGENRLVDYVKSQNDPLLHQENNLFVITPARRNGFACAVL